MLLFVSFSLFFITMKLLRVFNFITILDFFFPPIKDDFGIGLSQTAHSIIYMYILCTVVIFLNIARYIDLIIRQ